MLVKSKENKGFTLIELLIVIGILGVLAAAILVALNPLEQFARGRDSGRLTAVDQIGHSVQSYSTSQNSSFPAQGTSWLTTMMTASEIKSLPSSLKTVFVIKRMQLTRSFMSVLKRIVILQKPDVLRGKLPGWFGPLLTENPVLLARQRAAILQSELPA